MKYVRSALLLSLLSIASVQVQAESMASIAITPATGEVTLVPRWAVGSNLAGFHLMAQDLSLGGGANQFYSIKGTPIPAGGDIAAFTRYIAASGAATNHADIGSKLTPNSYSALTSADPDVGFGPVNFYFIHHKASGDYFTTIVPSSGTASAVTDLKPMDGPGGPATLGVSGYFGLTFAASNLGYGLNLFYYLRTDPVTGFTKFGTLVPALLGTSADRFDLGVSGYNALAFTGTDVGFGTDKMYYLRLDPITGFTILGTLHPVTGRAADIANLGSVYSALTFVPGDVGFGSGNFYTAGAVNPTWQSVSFAAIADRAISAGSFTVTPSASSTLPIALTVVPGSTGSAAISGPVAGVFTVSPTAPGLITLQATQTGQVAPIAYEFNMLRQSFTASGVATLAVTTQPVSQSAALGGTVNFSVVATGTTTVSYQWRKAGTNITGNSSATTATLSLTNVQAADSASFDVVVSNASGSISSSPVFLTLTSAAPTITNSSLTSGGTVLTAFSFAITASGSPTSYTASPLPPGLSVIAATGVITGTPTAAGTTAVLLGATNASGTGNATLTITIAAAGTAPAITNNPATAGGTVGTPLSLAITASGSPTNYTATPLPAGLAVAGATGIISGTPSAAGITTVLLGATNSSGTGNATLTLTIAAVGVAPVITNNSLTAGGALGTPFNFQISAAGSPTSYAASPLPAGLSLVAATGVITGTPTAAGTTFVLVGATNAVGTSTAIVRIVIAAPSSRIVNFSARALSGAASQTLILGFVVSGNGKNLLVRGVGPALTNYGVSNALSDPMLTVFGGSSAVAVNDDWQIPLNQPAGSPVAANGAIIAATAAQSGAFVLAAGSKDAALLVTFNGGLYTTSMARANGLAGIALTEVYDVDSQPGARLINVSARMSLTAGEGTPILGLVIAGTGPKTVLVRGIGPGLTSYGVSGVLGDPTIVVFAGNTAIASNDNWETGTSTAAAIIAASTQVGAFALPSGSKDAALLITLQPGLYTVHTAGVDAVTGVTLVEVYDMD